ncbi:hypothetical protein AMAG_07695 [Allomyces macrogynus ATCC 38327]|uniref:C2H2-type domain-containing protein n=1 Tax=Allomyces macrogynus (strain ATCC 38327) TaxID=578462 RepID=A0A0L0SJ76_ALLM3|nr:hypothetical protein AMAG_07695 [Allomyces macrogynus ATCC 38327]|eukprot:KNE62479.1 hypothetical protein AMAG_07695 [Allomyces macrogynus ATCC 38327]
MADSFAQILQLVSTLPLVYQGTADIFVPQIHAPQEHDEDQSPPTSASARTRTITPPTQASAPASPSRTPPSSRNSPATATAVPSATGGMYCAACKKSFATAQTWAAHEQSGKHQQNVKKMAGKTGSPARTPPRVGTPPSRLGTPPKASSVRGSPASVGVAAGSAESVGAGTTAAIAEVLLKLKKAKAIEDGNASLAATVYWNIAQALWSMHRDPRDTAVALLHLWKLLAKYTDATTAATPPPLQLGLPPERRRVQVNLALARLLSTVGGRQAPPRDLVRSWVQLALPPGLVSAVDALVADHQDALGLRARTTAAWLATVSSRGTQATAAASARVLTPSQIGAVVGQWVERTEWTAPELGEAARLFADRVEGLGMAVGLAALARGMAEDSVQRVDATLQIMGMLRDHGRFADVVCWAADALAVHTSVREDTAIRAKLAETALEGLAAAIELIDVVSARRLLDQAGAVLGSGWIELQWVAWCVRAPAAPPAHRVAGHMLYRQVQAALLAAGRSSSSSNNGARRQRGGGEARLGGRRA